MEIVGKIESALKGGAHPDLAKELKIEESEVSYFLKQYNVFSVFSESEAHSDYANSFNDVNFFKLELDEPHKPETFIRAVATFINTKGANKTDIKIAFQSEKDIERVLSLLKEVQNASKYFYLVEGNGDLPFEKYPELLKIIDKVINDDFFTGFAKKMIDKLIEVDKIFYLDLDKCDLDKIIKYSQKYPNKIRRLYSFSNKEYEKIQKICLLNKDSLIQAPNEKIELITECKHIEIISVSSQSLPKEIPNDFNFENIKSLELLRLEDVEDDEEVGLLVRYLNKCPNLENITFSSFCSFSKGSLIKLFLKVKCPKIKYICANFEGFDDGEEEEVEVEEGGPKVKICYEELFKAFPKLERLDLEEHNSMDVRYTILPCYSNEGKEIPLPCLEKLLSNYVHSKEGNYIRLTFYSEFNEFFEYFKDKKDILEKVSYFSNNEEEQNQTPLPFIKSVTISDEESISKNNVLRVEKLIIQAEVQGLQDYINKVKPSVIEVSGPFVIGVQHVKDVPETKVIYDLTAKKIWIRNVFKNCEFEEYKIKEL